MRIIDFLDSGEQRQVQIVQLLMDEYKGIKVMDLARKLSSNRNTIKEDLEKLQSNLDEQGHALEIVVEDHTVHLIVHQQVSFTKVLYGFLSESLRYKLVVHMPTSKQVSHQTLAGMMNISLSTLTRKIRELNVILGKYHLKINKGKIEGSEIAIRYFYFQLFWFGIPYQVNIDLFVNPSVKDLLAFLEKKLDFPFTDEGRVKLCIWLYITKCRFRNTRIKHELPLSDQLLQAFNQSAFVGLQEIFIRFFSRYAFQWNQSESEYLYLFMIASYTLDSNNSYVKELFVIAQTNEKTTCIDRHFLTKLFEYIPERLLKEDFRNKIGASLLQIHYKILYFPSFFSIWGNTNLETHLMSAPNAALNRLAEELTKQTISLIEGDVKREDSYNQERLHEEIFSRYLVILHTIYHQLNIRLEVGCDFPFERTMNLVIIESLVERISPRVKVHFSVFQKNKSYDAIITYKDDNPEIPEDMPTYTLLSIEHTIDFPALNNFLYQQYQNKINSKVNLA